MSQDATVSAQCMVTDYSGQSYILRPPRQRPRGEEGYNARSYAATVMRIYVGAAKPISAAIPSASTLTRVLQVVLRTALAVDVPPT